MSIGLFMPNVTPAPIKNIPDPNIDDVALAVGMDEWMPLGSGNPYETPMDTSVRNLQDGLFKVVPDSRNEDGLWGRPSVKNYARGFGATSGFVGVDASWRDIINGNFTLEMWIKFSGSQSFPIVSFTQSLFLIFNGTGIRYSNSEVVDVVLEEWIHISLVRVGETVALRVNGELVLNHSADIPAPVSTLMFGGVHNAGTLVPGSGNSSYADIRVWSKAIHSLSGSIQIPTGPWESPT